MLPSCRVARRWPRISVTSICSQTVNMTARFAWRDESVEQAELKLLGASVIFDICFLKEKLGMANWCFLWACGKFSVQNTWVWLLDS